MTRDGDLNQGYQKNKSLYASLQVEPGLPENKSLYVSLQFPNRLLQNVMKEIHNINKSEMLLKNEKSTIDYVLRELTLPLQDSFKGSQLYHIREHQNGTNVR